MRAEEYSRRQTELDGWAVSIETYRLGNVYYCSISNVDPGARFVRAQAPTRDEAETTALEKASRFLKQTRRFEV